MEYKKGYVCFIDILGFSSFVKNSENIKKTYDLFDFIKNTALRVFAQIFAMIVLTLILVAMIWGITQLILWIISTAK